MIEAQRSVRMLEERYTTLRKKNQISDQNIIDDTNKTFMKLKQLFNEINDVKVNIDEMKEKLDIFSIEIGEMASRHELKVLKNYINLWEPMKFLTEKQAIRIIKEELSSKKED